LINTTLWKYVLFFLLWYFWCVSSFLIIEISGSRLPVLVKHCQSFFFFLIWFHREHNFAQWCLNIPFFSIISIPPLKFGRDMWHLLGNDLRMEVCYFQPPQTPAYFLLPQKQWTRGSTGSQPTIPKAMWTRTLNDSHYIFTINRK
jgi:hypothetical protein